MSLIVEGFPDASVDDVDKFLSFNKFPTPALDKNPELNEGNNPPP
jgi:hypothetical protein